MTKFYVLPIEIVREILYKYVDNIEIFMISKLNIVSQYYVYPWRGVCKEWYKIKRSKIFL